MKDKQIFPQDYSENPVGNTPPEQYGKEILAAMERLEKAVLSLIEFESDLEPRLCTILYPSLPQTEKQRVMSGGNDTELGSRLACLANQVEDVREDIKDVLARLAL